MKKITSLIFLTLLLSRFLLYAEGPGTTSAQLLKIGVGARPVALGETYAGISDDVTSIYWNVAGLNQTERPQISAMHAIWFENIFFDYLAGVYPTKLGKFGLMVNYLSMDAIEKYNRDGNKVNQSYTPSDIVLNFSFAKKYKELNYGLTLKYIQSQIEEESASGYGMDIGLLYVFANRPLSVGFTAKNIGTEVKFINEGFPLPISLRAGAAYRFLKRKNLLVGLDVDLQILESITNLHLGVEYVFSKIKFVELALRAGYKTNTISALGSSTGITAGVGFVILKDISVDYAWVPYGDLGQTHRISLAYTFSKFLPLHK